MEDKQVRFLKILHAIPFLLLPAAFVAAQSPAQSPAQAPAQATPQTPEIPLVDGGLGACRADFTVKDGSGKPLYDAKVHVIIKYGFFSKRKTELEVGTNSDGKARVTGLPNMPKKPLEFSIKSGTVSTTVTDDPSDNCNATFDVTLTVH
jgi:hypothetical protein